MLSQAGEADAPAEPVDLVDAARRAAARFPEGASAVSGAPSSRAAHVLRAGRPRPHARRPDRERAALRRRAAVTAVPRPGALRSSRRGPGHRPGRARAGLRALPPRQRRPCGPAGHRPGLPIARELMRRWGGDVRLANREGGGAAATLELPLTGLNPPGAYGLSHDATRALVPRCPRGRRARRGRDVRGQLALHPRGSGCPPSLRAPARPRARATATPTPKPRPKRTPDPAAQAQAQARARPQASRRPPSRSRPRRPRSTTTARSAGTTTPRAAAGRLPERIISGKGGGVGYYLSPTD